MPTRKQYQEYIKTEEGQIIKAVFDLPDNIQLINALNRSASTSPWNKNNYRFICGATFKDGTLCRRVVRHPQDTCIHHSQQLNKRHRHLLSATGRQTMDDYRYLRDVFRFKNGHSEVNYQQHPTISVLSEMKLIRRYVQQIRSAPEGSNKFLQHLNSPPYVKVGATVRIENHIRSAISYEKKLKYTDKGLNPDYSEHAHMIERHILVFYMAYMSNSNNWAPQKFLRMKNKTG